jgi:hypothetical protein
MEGTGQGKRLTGGNFIDCANTGGRNLPVKSFNADNSHLHDSEFSADSTDSNNHIDGRNGWIGGMGTDFRNIALCLTENVAPVVSGVASLVHRTAVAVVNELAQLERAGDADFKDRMNDDSNIESYKLNPFVLSAKVESKTQSLMLPWEVINVTTNGDEDNIPVYFTDNILMEDILSLSSKESTFLKPFQTDDDDKSSIEDNANKSFPLPNGIKEFSATFVVDESRIKLIRRLMDIDKNLASMHSRFTGKWLWEEHLGNVRVMSIKIASSLNQQLFSSGKSIVKEEVFWKNYFYHCEELRKERLGWNDATKYSTVIPSPKHTGLVETIAINANCKMRSSLNLVSSIVGDNESLNLGQSASETDDSSYVITSAPNSVNTFMTSRSIDDLVVITTPLDPRGEG